MKPRNSWRSRSLSAVLARFRTWVLFGLGILVAAYLILRLSGISKANIENTPSARSVVHESDPGPASQDQDVLKFRQHVQWIHSLVQKSYEHVLAPWKLNQNVSVSTQEDAFGNALLRVICLQSHGTPGVMQVGVTLMPDTEYELRLEGCTFPSADSSKFRACPFIDQIGADRSSQLVLWNCSAALREHPEAGEGGLPCSDLAFHRGASPHNRFQRSLSFKTMAQGSETASAAHFRIGVLFSAARPGDVFFLKEVCWKPKGHIPSRWDCGHGSDSLYRNF